ncbi:hypothetical protein [Klebsiella quasipneumoniae]|uniref:hypothetical protein n=1 Tax=Klebsiella quasipneumoniae TaxID=1463165 RepID=UPI0029A56677|nr:hypothetical protein [Klebsiella quasipneumoniae]MEB6597515.1 hypothetical protein [Klebsiella quasipneumoniae]HBR1015556.1 hypothetical protein [Klebsiella quasipneumoniae subsp. similipneumoniae]HBR1557909.1 hypothetical protein [Klebsiella quasipneumoniae subsp. quasipneumoniae]HCQ8820276.1 hypothetical protein [Klebsiella pneumoniae]
MNTRNINLKTAAQETSPSCFEPKAEKVIAFHGKGASYAYNVLADLKAADAAALIRLISISAKLRHPKHAPGCFRTKQNS